eukprot:1887676-Pyramimonas_sp.AAC.1
MQKPDQPLGDLADDEATLISAKWFDDAASLVTHFFADAGQIANRRVQVVIAALRDYEVGS